MKGLSSDESPGPLPEHDVRNAKRSSSWRSRLSQTGSHSVVTPSQAPRFATLLPHRKTKRPRGAAKSLISQGNLGGRCRVRTCDPCRVKARNLHFLGHLWMSFTYVNVSIDALEFPPVFATLLPHLPHHTTEASERGATWHCTRSVIGRG